MDTLRITDLELWTRIGVTKEERRTEQRLLVSVMLEIDAKQAAMADDVTESIDYHAVVMEMQLLAFTQRNTIERFAEDIAEHVLQTFKPESVTVRMEKFALPFAKSASVEILRCR